MKRKTLKNSLTPGEGRHKSALTAGLLALLTIVLPTSQVNASEAEKPTSQATENKQADSPWGIEVLGIRSTAANYMLEFRYRVVDSEKAAYLMDRKLKPELLVEETGRKLHVPVSSKLGPIRQSPKFPATGRNYFMFFANPGRAVEAGDRVSIRIGDFSADRLTVE